MEEKIIVKSNTYADSVTLMALSQKVQRFEGVDAALVGMGTPLNLGVLNNLKFNSSVDAGANDLVIAIRAVSEEALTKAFTNVDELLNSKGKKSSSAGSNRGAKTFDQIMEYQDSNLALISVPGTYAAREARKAMEKNLHVMLFSDNVSIEDEAKLKQIAHDKGLLMMGPDCGTAIINGIPLAFANVVRRGTIGVVGASGTGTQEVTVQIDRMGQGISQAIGTGGRDLKENVGGRMMLDGIEALKQDPETKVIVVVSKPASISVTENVVKSLEECGKPSVLYIIGTKGKIEGTQNVRVASNLLETAQIAVELANGTPIAKNSLNNTFVDQTVSLLKSGQKYVRGLFSGGTLCDEAMEVLTDKVGLIYSNGPLDPTGQLDNPNKSFKNTVLDLGDDFFTVGRPHPMIDFSMRLQRIEDEAQDSEVAVILLDVVLGYGSHSDPALELAPVIKKAKETARKDGRELVFVIYVCGTLNDPQGYEEQAQQLKDAGAILFGSNVEAAEFTAAILSAVERGER